jgi:hypothetical protein
MVEVEEPIRNPLPLQEGRGEQEYSGRKWSTGTCGGKLVWSYGIKETARGGDAHPVHFLELLAERLLRHLEPHEG